MITRPQRSARGERSGTIQSVERAVAVLKLFGEAEPELGVTELARRLKLHKSTVSRLLSTLESGGFVQQDPLSGRYRLGLQLATLAGLALTQYEFRDIARPLLQELATRSGETITLSVLDGDVAVNIEQALAPNPVKHLGWIGRRLPLHCTAAGKPLLAFLPAAQIDRLLSRPLERFTARTVTNPMLLRRELEHVHAQGFAIAQEEYEVELSAAGAPVRDHRGEVVASITVSGPSFRLPLQRMVELGGAVRATADRISAQLGHRPAGAAVMATTRPHAQTREALPAAPVTRTPAGPGRAVGVAGRAGGAKGVRRPQVGIAGPVFGS
ncbi:MAG: IclR family transcriptional regulator [Chloroflexi bacterium]|nr:IclR family transcriptional regulator [Chloroflexota bacterium]